MYKLDAKVKISEYHCGHGFEIGEVVTIMRVTDEAENGNHEYLASNGEYDWYVRHDEVEPIINPANLRKSFAYLKKRALSEGCGVPASNVSRWLAGGDIPRKHYPKISEVTGLTLEELCEVEK